MKVKLHQITCANKSCRVSFWITDDHYDRLRECHNTFYCPNGHSLYYPGKTKEEKRIEHLNDVVSKISKNRDFYERLAKERYEEIKQLTRSRAYYKGVVTRLKRRK